MTEAGPPSASAFSAIASAGDSSSGTTLQKLKAALSPSWPTPAVAIVIALCPLAYCLLRGAMGASLWLDEVLYVQFERQPEMRAVVFADVATRCFFQKGYLELESTRNERDLSRRQFQFSQFRKNQN